MQISKAYVPIFIGTLIVLMSTGCCTPTSAIPRIPPEKIKEHISALGIAPTSSILLVDTQKQILSVFQGDQVKKIYQISTSKVGIGQRIDTFRTPQGLHRINEKIGDGVPAYGIFNRRQYVGAAWARQPRHQHIKDYISTRILRLEGLQIGFNRGRDKWGKVVDSETRAIYIHGTTMEWKLGAPSTKGCVHMSAKDVIKLFEEVPVGTLVWIN
jgi:lipoprotein-anchoring transpeptidase ErfK/SrfK